jgi:hypothetical protein
MTWFSEVVPVFVIAFTLTILVRWSLASLLTVGVGFGVLHWIAIGAVFGYGDRGGAVTAFVLVVGLHAVAWSVGVVAAARVRNRARATPRARVRARA